jgi:hypothetical protein
MSNKAFFQIRVDAAGSVRLRHRSTETGPYNTLPKLVAPGSMPIERRVLLRVC